MEGLHLTAWMGKPLKGRRIWHRYYSLGYDTEADCTEADTRPDAIRGRNFNALVYGSHPYGLRSSGEAATVAGVHDDL